jgi:hypothetical protein
MHRTNTQCLDVDLSLPADIFLKEEPEDEEEDEEEDDIGEDEDGDEGYSE